MTEDADGQRNDYGAGLTCLLFGLLWIVVDGAGRLIW
jgi:hypothetical protein